MTRKFDSLRKDYLARKQAGTRLCKRGSKQVAKENTVALLNAVIRKGDRVCQEGNNQKQADFLANALLHVDRRRVRDLHMVQSSIVLDAHTELFRRGIARKLDFAYAGPQARPLYDLVVARKLQIGAIHTYLELYGRYFMDLVPRVSLVAAEACDKHGNLYTGHNTEDTPVICEATRFKQGIVVAQVKKVMARLPRVDIPGDWVDFTIATGKDPFIKPLFTRDPAKITDKQVLMAMMALKGIYKPYAVRSLNHGVGYATAAVELILPTYGKRLGLKGKCCTHWALNPHPTLIPAIEAGFVEHVYSFGGEPGTDDYVRARSDIFAVGPDGNMRSNRCNAHVAGLYAVDMFVGATLQIDRFGNSSTAVKGMIAGFGGAPNLGSTPPGRRNQTPACRMAGREQDGLLQGRKLVVQITPTVSEKKGIPVFVNQLDAQQMHQDGLFSLPPVMIPGNQLTHIVTEQGIAYLDKCPDSVTRTQAVAAVAGNTELARTVNAGTRAKLRKAGIVRTPAELGIDPKQANRALLAARSLQDLVRISGGLYRIPPGL